MSFEPLLGSALPKSDSAVYYLRQQHKFGFGYAARRRQRSPQFSANWFVHYYKESIDISAPSWIDITHFY